MAGLNVRLGLRARGQLAAPFLSVQSGLNLFTS